MDNKTIVRRFSEEIVNTGDVSGIAEVIADEYTEVVDGKRYPVGVEGAASHVLGVRRTYPGLFLTIDRQIAEGEWVATCITARGTHKGEWIGIAPTGRELVFTGVNVDRVVDVTAESGRERMIKAYFNCADSQVVIHQNPNCAHAKVGPDQIKRHVLLDPDSISKELDRFRRDKHPFAAEAGLNDLWLILDFQDAEFEKAVVCHLKAIAGNRYPQFANASVQLHC